MKKIFLLFLILSSFVFAEEARIASFNAYRLGDVEKDYKLTAQILSSFDIVGLVEVIKKEGVEKLVDELNKQSSEKWSYHISPYGVGSKKHKEYFAYIYKKNRVRFLKSVGFYKNMRSKLLREPYGANFKIGDFDFTFILVHNIYGKNIGQRKAENKQMVEVYDYFQDMDIFENDILIAGDFNLYALDSSFKNLYNHKDEITYALDTKLKTTVGYNSLANSYDNFFYSQKYTPEFIGIAGTIDFASRNPSFFRKFVSDHLPVFIVVDTLGDDD